MVEAVQVWLVVLGSLKVATVQLEFLGQDFLDQNNFKLIQQVQQ
jgi:hypothetical protein